MKHVAAYLLAVLGGNQKPTAKDLEKILDSVGIDTDSAKLKHLLSELEGKDIHEVICAGREKMASIPTGGVAVAAGGGGAPGGGTTTAAAEDKPEEKEEEEESEDEDMGFSLFD